MAGSSPVSWVVGGSGLLGSALRRRAELEHLAVTASPVPWDDPDRAVEALLEQASRLPVYGWRLAWCAGGAVVASDEDRLAAEVAVIAEFLKRWQPGAAPGRAIFVASSAGGLYAGSSNPPFSEDTVPAPVAPYGHAKLEVERLFSAFAGEHGIPLLIGRISNLYGPGQNLGKGQGLISMLCRAHVTGEPLSIYVPRDTMRDYLYVDDAADMILAGLDLVAAAGGEHVKILASGSSVTIGELIGELRRITRVSPPVLSGQSDAARFQVLDLRMRSTAWPVLQDRVQTSLAAGMASCLAAVEANLRCPQHDAVLMEGSA